VLAFVLLKKKLDSTTQPPPSPFIHWNIFSAQLSAQEITSSTDTAAFSPYISSKYIDNVSSTAGKLESKLDKESGKIL